MKLIVNGEEPFKAPPPRFVIGQTSAGYTLEYGVDGENWNRVNYDGSQQQIVQLLTGSVGDSVYVRGQAIGYADIQNMNPSVFFSQGQDTVKFNVEGDIVSMLGEITTTPMLGCLAAMFTQSNVVDASNLVFHRYRWNPKRLDC